VQLFTWKPEYEINFPKIDNQHRGLVGIVNDLYEAKLSGETEPAVVQTIDRLIIYVDVHFRDEEAAMQEWYYPGLGRHRIEHAELEKQVYALRKKIETGRGVATFELLNFLSEWFKVHILTSDKEFGRFVETRQSQNANTDI